MGSISLTIDGRTVEVEAGKTVLEAARTAGIHIPTICDHKDLNPYGSCRMCIVEIEGVRGYPTSCTTPAAEGMQVKTQSARLTTLRNRTLELMFSGHPNSCLVCVHREECEKYRPNATKAARSTRCGFCANRDECDLRRMVLQADSRELNLSTLYAGYGLERDDPFMDRDYNLCILCGRCWRICEKIHGQPAISIINRGKWARIGTAFDKSHVFSGCVFCGACIDICPTGTLTDRFARWHGKAEATTPSTCILCSEGCSINAESKKGQLLAAVMTGFEAADSLCALGRFGLAQIVGAPNRLIRPQVREGEDLIPTDWEAALSVAAEGLRGAAGAIVFAVSETTSREDRFLYGRLAERLGGRLMLLSTSAGNDDSGVQALIGEVEQGALRGLVTNGDLVPAELVRTVPFSLVIDCLPSPAADHATVVLPAAVLSETGGTFRTAAGTVKNLAGVSRAPGNARPEWAILADLGQALGEADFVFARVEDVTPHIESDLGAGPLCRQPAPARARTAHALPRPPAGRHRPGAGRLRPAGDAGRPGRGDRGRRVRYPREARDRAEHALFPHRAEAIARFARPGQFIILMARETSERSPFTLVDWNADEGWISLVIEEVGPLQPRAGRAQDRRPHRPCERSAGHAHGHRQTRHGAARRRLLRHRRHPAAGPGPARGRQPGDRGRRGQLRLHRVYMEEQLRGVCDELIVATKDGSRGSARRRAGGDRTGGGARARGPVRGHRLHLHDAHGHRPDQGAQDSHPGGAQPDHGRRHRHVRRLSRVHR